MASDSHAPTSVQQFGSLHGLLRFKTRSVAAWWGLYGIVLALMFVANIRFLFPGGLKAKLMPEEYFSYKLSPNGTLLLVHLACVLPASMLSIIQFIPRLRTKYRSWHRYAGRVINVLTMISSICGIAIGRVSFGGDLATQTATFALGTMVLYSVVAGWKAIRERKIEEHSIWMVRAWAYQMSIVTMRVIMPITMILIDARGGYYVPMTCEEVANSLNNTDQFVHEYPQCQPDWTGKPVESVSIRAGSEEGLALAAGARATFGMAAWVAVWIHFICTERYIAMSRRVSKLEAKSN
ncbi:unnamed protein product [Rhizoctonia solani]|uniref:DUF2306 domain-containing protein n=1 Tax=Rhizoctonia solani TaxID=456999 RepID=A0A8H2WGP6_9AGAM|nr:unnamed protein product [Rhizoctonia solani]